MQPESTALMMPPRSSFSTSAAAAHQQQQLGAAAAAPAGGLVSLSVQQAPQQLQMPGTPSASPSQLQRRHSSFLTKPLSGGPSPGATAGDDCGQRPFGGGGMGAGGSPSSSYGAGCGGGGGPGSSSSGHGSGGGAAGGLPINFSHSRKAQGRRPALSCFVTVFLLLALVAAAGLCAAAVKANGHHKLLVDHHYAGWRNAYDELLAAHGEAQRLAGSVHNLEGVVAQRDEEVARLREQLAAAHQLSAKMGVELSAHQERSETGDRLQHRLADALSRADHAEGALAQLQEEKRQHLQKQAAAAAAGKAPPPAVAGGGGEKWQMAAEHVEARSPNASLFSLLLGPVCVCPCLQAEIAKGA